MRICILLEFLETKRAGSVIISIDLVCSGDDGLINLEVAKKAPVRITKQSIWYSGSNRENSLELYLTKVEEISIVITLLV